VRGRHEGRLCPTRQRLMFSEHALGARGQPTPCYKLIYAQRIHPCTNNWVTEEGKTDKSFAISKQLVDVTGIEPVTPCLQRTVVLCNGSFA